ncbi:Alcohol dehydrogenase, class IV [Cohaesibacter sp. ES.047]|uniref:iron-containing alcohol dehydrogenase n=1 Tax=Cohaesibacter sp. ES.047 TaxID=1798205 RepID=UPI000BC00223|nr:iron-containing alcohol dehydrogenase [Cohaesibacter sp. ES.047]SNY92682.1 Alcohol dehydrogenase, class IV [Cohaesibacter sp. ES.047]
MQGSSFGFLTSKHIRFGRGVAKVAVSDIARLGSPILLVHGRDKSRAQWLIDALTLAGTEVASLAVAREPDVTMIEDGVKVAKQAGVKAVVALGGGAVIDAGKALAALVPALRPAMDHLEVVGKGLPLSEEPLPFAALPTTSGTGAEVTKNAVLSVPEAKRKVSLRDDRMLPDLAIVDPGLTDGCPKSITLASGLDAVTQVIEPYLSSKANWMTDALCRSAIASGMAALVRLMETEDSEARDQLAFTSLCGGLALANSGLGAVHGLAGVLGGVTSAPHGALCGTLLPHVLEHNEARLRSEGSASDSLARFSEVRGWLAAALSCSSEDVYMCLQRWSAAHGLPSLSELGLQEEDIPAIAEASQASSSMKGNPLPLSAAELADILNKAL